jgi:hypothetical protein
VATRYPITNNQYPIPRWNRWLLVLFLAALAVRIWRPAWQPLWWDEGYSVYFATEPLARMVELTASDIHPPLYYALLHGWARLFGGSGGGLTPVPARLFSVLAGALGVALIFWLGTVFFPARRRIAVIAALLLLLSPLHLYYSQEVRMYGLAAALGMAATGCFWAAVRRIDAGRPARGPLIGYALCAALGLYTLYYLALLLAAHGLWALWHFRRRGRALLPFLAAWLAAGLLYLPWLIYALPRLTGYVAQKVQSDQDRPLNALEYAWVHLSAFAAGSVVGAGERGETLWLLAAAVGAALLVVLVAAAFIGHDSAAGDEQAGVETPAWEGRSRFKPAEGGPEPGAPSAGVETPAWTGESRFKPAGAGELPPEEAQGAQPFQPVSTGLGSSRRGFQPPQVQPARAAPALLAFVLIPALGAYLLNLRLPFFPQGGERLLLFVLPYALLLAAAGTEVAVARLGRAGWALAGGLLLVAAAGIWAFYTAPRHTDHDYRPLLAQVVRAGAPGDTLLAIFPWTVGYWRAYAPAGVDGPQPLLLGDGAVEYGPEVEAAASDALARGTLWFPEPLSFGASLPSALEAFLREHALNLENRWYSPATRLTAWAQRPAGDLATAPVGADFGSARLAGAGVQAEPVAAANAPLALRLEWDVPPNARLDDLAVALRLVDAAGREWAARDYTPPGAWATEADGGSEIVGLIVPAGTPPGSYTVAVGLIEGGELRAATLADGTLEHLVPIGEVTVTPAAGALDPAQLALTGHADPVRVEDGLAVLGAAAPQTPVMAGTPLAARVGVQGRTAAPPLRRLYVSLQDARGNGVAGWQGWPLPGVPTSALGDGALLLVPVEFDLPATLPTGDYTLVAGWLDPDSGARGAPAQVARVRVEQRAASFAPASLPRALDPAPLLGTHARLVGYDVQRDGDALAVTLYWNAEQTLLPPHHVFVHADDAAGVTLAQDDGPPATASGPAPTGSWLPGETLATLHTLPLPAAESATVLRVGLYDPRTEVRLPVTVGGAPAGDAVEIPLP